MTSYGYFLSSEERPGSDLVDGATLAEQAGFGLAWLSDHFHPWLDAQGQSPFVWTTLGGIARATSHLKVTTAVTCPTVRIHPLIIAQAAATTQELMGGRFSLGVGSGENLNEHVLGDHWPPLDTRLEMLEEAIGLIRELWEGRLTTHYGEHYVVENARIYTRHDTPPEILVSGLGAKSIELAARVGDGFISVEPDPDAIARYRRLGGKGRTQAGLKVCYAPSVEEGRDLVHRLWPNELLPGQLSTELALPSFFEQASSLVTADMVESPMALGPDPERHIAALKEYADAGFDEVYVAQVGPDQAGMLDFYRREVLPALT